MGVGEGLGDSGLEVGVVWVWGGDVVVVGGLILVGECGVDWGVVVEGGFVFFDD